MSNYSLLDKEQPFSALVGKTLKSVIVSDDKDEIRFITIDGDAFLMYHFQDCCESVTVDDICGDIDDIIGSQIVVADEVSSCDSERDATAEPHGWQPDKYEESYKWTFYKIDTVKGGVTIRWFGASNGYYSESVDFALESSAADNKGE